MLLIWRNNTIQELLVAIEQLVESLERLILISKDEIDIVSLPPVEMTLVNSQSRIKDLIDKLDYNVHFSKKQNVGPYAFYKLTNSIIDYYSLTIPMVKHNINEYLYRKSESFGFALFSFYFQTTGYSVGYYKN